MLLGCVTTQDRQKTPLTKNIPALQESSKHFLPLKPNLCSFQLLFVGLLHLCKVHQDHQKGFGTNRSPNSSSGW